MRYTVDFKASAAKDMRRLPPEIRRRVADRIDSLKENPRPPGVEKLAEGRYRVRSGDFRIIYRIEDDVLLVLVLSIDDRKEVYTKKGKRRWE